MKIVEIEGLNPLEVMSGEFHFQNRLYTTQETFERFGYEGDVITHIEDFWDDSSGILLRKSRKFIAMFILNEEEMNVMFCDGITMNEIDALGYMGEFRDLNGHHLLDRIVSLWA